MRDNVPILTSTSSIRSPSLGTLSAANTYYTLVDLARTKKLNAQTVISRIAEKTSKVSNCLKMQGSHLYLRICAPRKVFRNCIKEKYKLKAHVQEPVRTQNYVSPTKIINHFIVLISNFSFSPASKVAKIWQNHDFTTRVKHNPS